MIGQDIVVQRQRMNATGIGLAGVDGVWWLPALKAFTLPAQTAHQLTQIGRAIFALFDAVTTLYGTPAGANGGLDALLNYKVPAHIPRLMSQGRVEAVRPDFQLCYSGGGSLNLVATELEICPSAHGFAHAMQLGYGLPADLVASFGRYLAGRELLFAGSGQWSEFLFEQLAFCRALAEVGAQGRVLYDLPLAALAHSVQQGQRWQPPMFGLQTKPPGWNDNILGRIRAHGLERFVWPAGNHWPDNVGNAVVFRFGYFDCFSPNQLNYFLQWQAQGATLLNPAMFILDSKVIMAALTLPVVREHLAAANPEALPALDRSIPPTLLLQPQNLARIHEDKDRWLIKYAGFDGGNQAWGGRSLQFGLHYSMEQWGRILNQSQELPWPVVAQQVVPSAQVDMTYLDGDDQEKIMPQGTTRLRTFFLRNGPDAVACGSHVTLSGGSMQVSEAANAVQAPVLFQD